MPVCELCGMDSPRAKRVFLEGTLLMLCQKCSKFGQAREEEEAAPVVGQKGPAPYTGRGKRDGGGSRELDTGELVLADDYHKRIGKARNNLGLTQEELGRKINERRSVINQLESKHLRPNDRLRKKLERALKIKLTERTRTEGLNLKEGKGGVTIGDIIKMKKKG